jgi:RNA polymerase sigma-70 factor (ECF subfamily)
LHNGIQNIDSIISGCKEGNRKAQEQLYRSYYRVMMNLCLRYTKNESTALEVLNTAFYKVFKTLQRYDPAKASLYTWIRTIVINSCLDQVKLQGNRAERNEAAIVHVPPLAISSLSASEILELVRQLPPATQAVFNLYVIEGYKHHEIAEMTGIREGTSKWHLSEARKKLQQMIKEQNVE